MIFKVTVKHGQTLLDVAIQYLGNAASVAQLAALNSLDMTSEITPGQILELPDVADKRVVKFLKDGEHVPATNYIDGDLEGIEFWGIESDFIVS